MERLCRAEDYLSRRQARAKFQAPCIFRDFGVRNCFSVRYFGQSAEHKDLLGNIESRATQARREKCNELKRKKEEHNSLMRLHNQSECDYPEVIVDSYNDFREQRHSHRCKKCGYMSQAASINIRIHEWPIPSNAFQVRSTVFELKVPCFFGRWRDTTVLLLLDILKAHYLSTDMPRARHPLHSYKGLSSYFTPFSSTQRIGLLSEDEPHEVTHRRNKSISITTESDVCLNNGLRYQYFDSRTNTFVDEFHVEDEILKLSTYKLPAQSASLQQFLFRPAAMSSGPSPNTVIASQSDCPDHMSLDEYRALSNIPLGYRIQWQNILLQLSAPSVDFKRVETGLVILQSIYQAGPSTNGNVLRAGHEIVDDENFAHALLASLHEALQRVKENWESSQALSIFISLAARLLSLTSAGQIRDRCLVFLTSVRAVAFGWVNLLRDKAHGVTNDSHRADLMSKAVEIALICADSFNVDKRYLDDTLAMSKDASVFIQCSIVIQEGNYTISKTCDPMITILHRRWKCLSYWVYPILAKRILEARSRSLDDAIKKSWSAYQAGDGWRAVSEQAEHWLVSQTAPQANSDPLWIHFNLLTGELLVNGLPLARLPSKYELHPAYRTLFGRSALEVMPTAVQGMQYSGKNEYAGCTLHFGINPVSGTPDYDLLVQAVKDDRKYELVPSRFFCGELPVAFVDKFVQWYDVADDCLELRPINDPWTSSPDNWRLKRTGAGSKWHLMKHGISLFREMAIDTNQSLGTLVGLRNKLMLKHESGDNRLVILPEGHVSYKKNNDHVDVVIDKDSAAKAHAYFVDGQIGRLVDNGSLQSMLFLCYLQALTSFCLPDPLTRRTGTEQALSMLKSAAVRSFDRLAKENTKLLGQIAHLTPGRSYYPANECVMQTVNWSPVLSFLAQHAGFYKCVESIFEQADKTKHFYPESYVQPQKLSHVDSHLLERDCIRSSTFRVSSFGAEDHTIKHDVIYAARDRELNSPRGCKAFVTSSLIYHGRATLHYNVSPNLKDHIWDFLSQTPEMFGPSHPLQSSDLMYDAGLLLHSSEFVSMHWSSLHRTISQAYPRFDKFRLMMWLSTLAVARDADMKIVQTLASLFTLPEMAQISAPWSNSFDLSQGTTVKGPELRSIVRAALLPFHRCPEARLSSESWESKRAFRERQQRQFQSNQNSALDRLINALQVQWPCENPATPTDDSSVAFHTYVDISKAMKGVKPEFKAWFDNYRFYQYLGQIGNTVCQQLVDPVETTSPSFAIPTWNVRRRPGFICIDDVFNCPAPSISPCVTGNLTDLFLSYASADKGTP